MQDSWRNSLPPCPKRILYEQDIALSWQGRLSPPSAGLVNVGNTCYLNASVQVGDVIVFVCALACLFPMPLSWLLLLSNV